MSMPGIGRRLGGTALALVTLGVVANSAPAAPDKAAPAARKPAAVERLEIAEWKYRDALEPSATAPTFDDSKWEVIKDPAKGRGTGGVSYGWYRTVLKIPEKLGNTPVAARPLQLSVLANDYAEVWLNGDFKFQFDPNQPASAPKNAIQGYEIAGFNKPNVINLAPLKLKPGDSLPIAILVANGPLGKPVGKYFLQYVRLEFAAGK